MGRVRSRDAPRGAMRARCPRGVGRRGPRHPHGEGAAESFDLATFWCALHLWSVETSTLAVILVAVAGLAALGMLLKRAARAALFAAVALVLALFGYYVWPTPYRFYSPSGRLLGVMGYREQRFTGIVDVLTPDGWVRTSLSRSARPPSGATVRQAGARRDPDSAALRADFIRAAR